MRLIYTENVHTLALPPGHKFPTAKYDKIHAALHRDHASRMTLAAPAPWEDLVLAHAPAYVRAVRDGTLPLAALRRLGFPWSESLVLRATRSVGGTLCALAWAMQEGAAGHIAGGTHHAFRDRGEGFCVFNDLAVAVLAARRDYGVERSAIVDLDVHQGNGTAAIFEGDSRVLTVSMHARRNYPFHKERSALDVELPDDTSDDAYLAALAGALDATRAHKPELLFYQAGVDGLRGDRLGRMALTHEGLARRDRAVYSLAKELGVPLVVTLGGGYGRVIEDSVRAHVEVYRELVRAFE